MNFHRRFNAPLYTKTARFDEQARALTEDEMRKLAPSIFATTAHESRSERFRPIPTIEVVRGLANEGFSVVGARQSLTRVPGKADFTKHLLRMRRLDDAQKHKVGDTVFEMLLKNANDGTAAYDLLGGLFRIACLNSMVSQTDTIDVVKVKHSGDVQSKVIEGTYTVLQGAETYLAAPQDWPAIKLERAEREAFAKAAHVLRFEDNDGLATTPITPVDLLVPRRQEDVAPNLWTVFNVVQENVIKGGLKGVRINAETGQRRNIQTRPIKGIDNDVKLNKALWVLAAEMAKLRAPAIAA